MTINVTNEAPTASPPPRFIHWARDPNPTGISLWNIFEDPDNPDGEITFTATPSDPEVTATVDNETGQLWLDSPGDDPIETAIELIANDPHGGSVTIPVETWSIDLQGIVAEERFWGDENWHHVEDDIWSSDEHRWSTTVVPAGAEQYIDWIEWRAEPWEGQSEPNETGSWFADSSAGEPAYGSPGTGDWFIYPVAFFQASEGEAKPPGARFTQFEVVSVEWEGVDPGDGETNLAPIGSTMTIYPERNHPPGTMDAQGNPIDQLHNQVKVLVTIDPEVPDDKAGADVQIGIYDPDIWLSAPDDWNDPDAATNQPDDNVSDGGLDGAGNPTHLLGMTPSEVELTIAPGENTGTTTHTISQPQPGNNFVAAAYKKDARNVAHNLEWGDDGVTLQYRKPGTQETLPISTENLAIVLEVWRTLWVEADHMAAPGQNDGPFTGDANCNGCDDVMATPTAPTITALTSLMQQTYVSVKELTQYNTQVTAPFKHHQLNTTVPTGLRNVQSSKYFWNVHMFGTYEWDPDLDNDPDNSPWRAGWSEHQGADDPTNFLFTETIRDLWDEPEWANMVALEMFMDRVSAHEALHRFFGWHDLDSAADQGIMIPQTAATAPNVSLTFRQVRIIQATEHPK